MNKEKLLAGGSLPALDAANLRSNEHFDIRPSELRGSYSEFLGAAYDRLMSGPKSKRPTSRAVRKTVLRLSLGLSIQGPWRSWRRIKEKQT